MIYDGGGYFMEILLMIILLILMCPLDNNSDNNCQSKRCNVRNKHFYNIESNTDNLEEFEEADSYFDSGGNEHLVDDDGYCEECDDYHDWD